MSETPVEIPTSAWERIRADKRRFALLVAAGVAALVLLGVFVVWAFAGGGAGGARDTAELDLPSLDGRSGETTASADATGSADSSGGSDGADGAGSDGTGDAGDGGEGGPAEPTRPEVDARRAPFVAFRLDGTIVVAREDGTRPVEVAESAEGGFALSPDGTLLALVDEGELAIVTVADGRRRQVGPAEPHGLAWTADSSALYFARLVTGGHGIPEVWCVSASGGSLQKVLQGGPAAVASDGTVAAPPVPAVLLLDPTRGTLWVAPQGVRPREIPVRGQAVECSAEEDLIAYAVYGMDYTDAAGVEQRIDPEIRLVRFDGSGERRLVGRPTNQRPFGYGNLMLSSDGSHLLFAEVGDDGYSRAFVVPTAPGGSPRALTVRRDTYPVGWSADGSTVFFVEGNAFQGEPTVLMSARRDGTARKVLVDGAGL